MKYLCNCEQLEHSLSAKKFSIGVDLKEITTHGLNYLSSVRNSIFHNECHQQDKRVLPKLSYAKRTVHFYVKFRLSKTEW